MSYMSYMLKLGVYSLRNAEIKSVFSDSFAAIQVLIIPHTVIPAMIWILELHDNSADTFVMKGIIAKAVAIVPLATAIRNKMLYS